MIDFQRECENLEFKATTYKIGACLKFPNPHSEIRNLKPNRPDKSFLTRILGGTS